MIKNLILLSFLFLHFAVQAFAQEESNNYQIALERIANAQRDGSHELVLNNLGLTTIPSEIGNLHQLERLYVSANLLRELPESFSQLENLQMLDLSANRFTEIPPELANMPNLAELRFDVNQFTEISIAHEFPSLRKLVIQSNYISRIDASIRNLTGLEELWLSNNQLQTLPPEVTQLQTLKSLGFAFNELSTVSPEIAQLTELHALYLNGNQLTELPPEIGQLQKLCVLYLSHNQFETLPIELAQIPFSNWRSGACINRESSELRIEENPLGAFPDEVVAQGSPAILEYLRNEAWWHLQRLIIGGASFAGITALAILGLRWRYNRRKPKRKNEDLYQSGV